MVAYFEWMPRFKKLVVWQKSKELNHKIYELTSEFPDHEKFGINAQLRRASISVCCNIAERCGKLSRKDQNRFIEISYGSLLEVWNLIYIAEDLRYCNMQKIIQIEPLLEEIAKMLSGLRSN